ncbi:MAG: single-stranded DNA-binding protein [Clostridiales bacterium]|nr:single-stranded DNA-binding protein [Eubacteriales bacterium]MCI7095079.1 single-stranded DNA-binding protein [Clostridiales bacterium]MDD6054861.1 single-stranded DNA-binding protein [Clostridiales bacterium]MDD7506003.1 single-stranded DNA-binding protein [Clostridiales bacterium]MDY5677382.1 single-stranded DNA-binding protein [Eubacteriales bacterium]
MNKVILIGRLTRDPDLRNVGNNIPVCRFSLAVDRPYRANGGQGEATADFFNIVVWRAQAENCAKYLQKGSQCAVTGRIENRSYDKDGEKRYLTEIIAESVEFLSRATSGGAAMGGAGVDEFGKRQPIEDLKPIEDADDDDLPF